MRWAPNCPIGVPLDSAASWIPAPTFSNLEDMAEMRSAILEARDLSGYPPEALNPSTPFDGDDSLFNAALDVIENGVDVSSGVPQLYSAPPSFPSSTSTSSSTVAGTSVTVNVDIDLSQTNSLLTSIRDDLHGLAGLTTGSVSLVEGSTDIVGAFESSLLEISSGVADSNLLALVHKLEVPESSAPLVACWSADFGQWGGVREVCLSDFPFLTWLFGIVKVIVLMTCLYISAKISMGVGMS